VVAHRDAEFLVGSGGREFGDSTKLTMGSLKGIVEMYKSFYGMFRGRTEHWEREGSGLMREEQKWKKKRS